MTLSAAFKVARKRHFCLFRNFVSAKLLASVNKGKQRRPAAAKPRLPRPRLAAASLRSVALQTCPCGAGAVLWSFGAMPGPLARQTTTPSLLEGEEDNAGRGPRHCPQNRCCPCSPMLSYIHFATAFFYKRFFDALLKVYFSYTEVYLSRSTGTISFSQASLYAAYSVKLAAFSAFSRLADEVIGIFESGPEIKSDPSGWAYAKKI